ncbi:hypothetical protein DM860_010794 [Cuscuta australis]|uniref:Protein kinase domain-containing protein n=1 Tax=Cuscuta australis TaxID=267555 RepID=A0A328DZY8_9ASTE|nr:hypothetical protein DM860_010794 [Cuscuta australis]
MTTPSFTVVAAILLLFPLSADALGGSSGTLAVMYGAASVTVCGIVAGKQTQTLRCLSQGGGSPFDVYPGVSFESVAGGNNVLCGVRSGGFSLLCWNSRFRPKRLYLNYTAPISTVTIGDSQICGLTNGSTRNSVCWRGGSNGPAGLLSISSGSGFSCGVMKSSNRVTCWGENPVAVTLETEFRNESMASITAGGRFACGMTTAGFLICKGSNENGELNVPFNSAYAYSGLSLGLNHSCAIRRSNQTIVCWGGKGAFSGGAIPGGFFESIVSGPEFSCGLGTSNLKVVCWGPGWKNGSSELLLPKILPGPCVESDCKEDCGVYPDYQSLCSGNKKICKPCDRIQTPSPPSPPPPAADAIPSPPSDSKGLRKGLLAFAVVGSVGAFAGICTIIYCLWTGVCFGEKKIHNSVQPTINGAPHNPHSSSGPVSRSSTIRRQGSRLVRRQRSRTSSKHADIAEEFAFPDLVAATDNFSPENKVGGGSFGIVYRGKLRDGREVAIKRGGPATKIFQEKETAFQSELSSLSRLHHKHLVRLVGFCEDGDERLLVYEYMKNGALHNHLHDKKNIDKSSNFLNTWRIRVKVALDASRGIEYLHSYAVPPIIHRDIKSSNILLDGNWTARVSDFGLSLMSGDQQQRQRGSMTEKAGTVGYIDPEYYGLNVVTAKSDVYGFGIVLLELLTGKRAIFKGEDGDPSSLVDYAVPAIMGGELSKVLDRRVGPPEEPSEADAVELVAYTAVHCVNLEGKDRPSMTDIVSNLERALALCEDSHGGRISSGQISIVSD